jgi:hypothetical protein
MTRRNPRRIAVPISEDVAVTPTPERRNHGIVERLERPIADESGRPARPYRAVDTLAAMERRGSITAGMRQAGEDFRARFATAQLDPLRAPDWSRLRVGISSRFRAEDEPGLRIEGSTRRRLARRPGGRWHRLARRLMPLACRGLGTVAEGMGARAGLEWPPGQPRGGVGDFDCGARCARGAFRHSPRLRS